MHATRQINITLNLTEDEAQWLQGVMQNPLHGARPETELKGDKQMRKKFWEAVTGITIHEDEGVK